MTTSIATDTKTLLVKQRSSLLSRIASLAWTDRPDDQAAYFRKEAEALLNEFILADRALSSIAIVKPRDFALESRPIDAVLPVLRDIAKPIRQEELIDAVVGAGFRSGDPTARLVVLKSIRIFLNGTGKVKQLIKEVNGLVGLWEWDDSLFHSEQ